MSKLPLEGITVVSLEQAVAAPFATRQLADLGARVIKIERPDVGDFARGYDESVFGQSSYFVWLNRSKESLALDLKDPRGLAILHELLVIADVFVENLGPGATARLGLSCNELARRYPKLVVCEVSGFGQTGPWADRKAYDLLVQSETGLVSITGKDDTVAKAGISVADIAAGMYAFSGILAALYRRETTGAVSSVDVSLFESLTEWMGSPHYYTMYSGQQPKRTGVDHATIAPYGLFSTKDGGAIVIAVQNEREWRSLCETLLGDASIASDPRFSKNAARVEHREAVRELVGSRISQLDMIEAEAILERANVAYAHMNSVRDAVEHPVLSARDRWREIDTPGGSVRALIPPVTLSGVVARMGPVPALGAQSAAILEELGMKVEDIAALAHSRVVAL